MMLIAELRSLKSETMGVPSSFSLYSIRLIYNSNFNPYLCSAAKFCVILEAVIGQRYLVITIARLLGVHTSRSMQKK